MTTEAAALMKDAYDLHVHCAPDTVSRKLDDDELARRALARGMKGVAIKSHYVPTADRAASVRARFPGFNAVGTLTLNSSVGGINPMAVETSAWLGAKIVWFPTMDSSHEQGYMITHLPHFVDMQVSLQKRGIPVPPVGVLDDRARLIEPARQVLELAAHHGLVVGTGHMSHAETFALAEAAHEIGFDKLVITHADWEATYYSIADQQRLVKLGATIEHCYTSPDEGHIEYAEVFEQVRKVGPDHVILTSDLGKTTGIYPDDGLANFAAKFLENGFSEKEVRTMLVEKPAQLVE
ncbi:MAG: DUF6282 family protein [Planctomycetaceae bacterium]|nr:DUF6282 family protein [Planctomycetaceae bacterium]